MYEENTDNLKMSVEEADTQEALPEQLAESQEFDGAPKIEGETINEEILEHCTCHMVDDHIQWLCDREVYRDRLADLLKKEPVIELETDSSCDE